MGVPFDESFLLRGQSLSHLGLTRTGLALCVDKTGGQVCSVGGVAIWSLYFYSKPRQRATIGSGAISPSRLHSKREGTGWG